MHERVLAPAGEPAVSQSGPIVRRRDRDDGLNPLADGVRLLVPGVAVEGLRAGEKLGIDAARAVADQVEALDTRELLTDACEVLEEAILSIAEAIGRQRRDRDDGDGMPQGFLQQPPQDPDQPVCEVVEAAEAGEAKEAGNEGDHIGRWHRTYLRADSLLSQRPARCRAISQVAAAVIECRAPSRQEPLSPPGGIPCASTGGGPTSERSPLVMSSQRRRRGCPSSGGPSAPLPCLVCRAVCG